MPQHLSGIQSDRYEKHKKIKLVRCPILGIMFNCGNKFYCHKICSKIYRLSQFHTNKSVCEQERSCLKKLNSKMWPTNVSWMKPFKNGI